MNIKKMQAIEKDGRWVLTDDLGWQYRTASPWQQALSEAIISVASGIGGGLQQCESEKDWKCVEDLINIYAHFFPVQYKEYIKANKVTTSMQGDKFGLLQDATTKKGGIAQVRQLGTWPQELEAMIRVIWPDQKFDKKFNEKFFKRFAVFRTAERI